MIKLIASDLDGTLLQGGAQQLTPRSIELIRQLIEKGIYFVAASGRQYANERRLFAPIKDDISYIAENGSVCVLHNEVISRSVIDPALVRRILNEVKKNPDFELLISHEDCCYVEDRTPEYVDHIVNVVKNTTKVVKDLRDLEGPVLKIAICSLIDDPAVVASYLEHLQKLFGAEIKVVTSGNIWIDFIAPGSNKGTALKTLISKLGLKPEECIAFGDQQNDIEMLEYVGTSYAMSTAAAGVSDHATYVTDSVEEVLERILKDL